jgi:hypothetical protein
MCARAYNLTAVIRNQMWTLIIWDQNMFVYIQTYSKWLHLLFWCDKGLLNKTFLYTSPLYIYNNHRWNQKILSVKLILITLKSHIMAGSIKRSSFQVVLFSSQSVVFILTISYYFKIYGYGIESETLYYYAGTLPLNHQVTQEGFLL